MFQTGYDEHQRLGGEKAIDVRGDARAVDADLVIVDPVLSAHHRIEAFRVEIAIVDLMPARA